MEDDKKSRLHAAIELRANKQYSGSIAAFEQLISDYPDYADGYGQLASLYLHLSFHDVNREQLLQKAEQHIRQAIKIDPQIFGYHSLLGLILRHADRNEESSSAYREAAKYAGDDPWDYFAIAMGLGTSDEAVGYYQETIRLDPENPNWRSNLGLLLSELGRCEEAISTLSETVQVAPNELWVRNNLASVLEECGEADRAREQYKEVIGFLQKPKLDFDDRNSIADAYNALAQMNRPPGNPERSLVFIGTYSKRGSDGIYVFKVDPETGALNLLSTAPAENPSHLALSPDGRFLYAVNELPEYEGQPGGAASAFAVDGATGKLTFLNRQPVQGAGPCHALVHPSGRWLVTANYGGGTHSILPIEEDGKLGSLRTLIAHDEAGAAKAHSTLFSPDGCFLYACTLGLCQTISYAFDVESGSTTKVCQAEFPSGSGPRHQALHPDNCTLYVLNEQDSTVSALRLNGMTGELDLFQTLSTVPADFTGRNACADLHLSPDGKFLYGSNRGHNSLAVFSIQDFGSLSSLGHVSTGGDSPRGFNLLENGLILVANERSDNIVAFRMGEDGVPIPTGAVTNVPCPVCVLPA